MAKVKQLLNEWKKDPLNNNITYWKILPPAPAQFCDFPEYIIPDLVEALRKQEITALYSHQKIAVENIHQNKNVVICTGTASGKTLCYNLPIVNDLLCGLQTTALYIFPTKALTTDQLNKIQILIDFLQIPEPDQIIHPVIYDGDVPLHERTSLRLKANIVLTNPDMLHTGILPHHTLWEKFFRNLKYIVIDEIHFYRGVFGSHLTNIIRRLKRISNFYGSNPKFILTSATLANASEFSQKIIEDKLIFIETDGSAYGERNVLLYNPPIINEELGLRKGIVSESVEIVAALLKFDIQSLLFARSRKTVEITIKYLHSVYSQNINNLKGYRSGYLSKERRSTEEGLRNGSIRVVVATNALELGIDMGGLDAVIMMGYPGSIAAFKQQSGRAGRTQTSSLAMLVASANPLDQFLIKHPDYLFNNSPEHALINPENPVILLSHLKCAAFELPFIVGDKFGKLEWKTIEPYLEFLSDGFLHKGEKSFRWMADAYPASEISIRSASPEPIILQAEVESGMKTIGEVDYDSANWMVHPGAIYLHDGNSFFVKELNHEKKCAILEYCDFDYYTEPKKEVKIAIQHELRQSKKTYFQRNFGEIQVSSKVIGFQKLSWSSREILGNESLEMPSSDLRTFGYWCTLLPKAVSEIKKHDLWSNDQNQYGPKWDQIRDMVRLRDKFTCQNCGLLETSGKHHVHHKIPFRRFSDPEQANQIDNLVTLCPFCHQRVEQNVRIRSGLSGFGYAIAKLAPILLMCDDYDIGYLSDPQSPIADMQPTVIIYDSYAGGIGLSDLLFENDEELFKDAHSLVLNCDCDDGCPSCVGASGEDGMGAKASALAILSLVVK